MSELPRVLFVDDEPNVLEGLRRLLRSKRNQWDMRFATGGAEALAVMAAEPIDVLVSDMRMPGMDGADLLAAVAKKHPDTVRFILSGQSDSDALFRAIGTCHQYISKPVPSDSLVQSIERSLRLRAIMRSPRVRAAISGLPSVPSPPAIYSTLLAELRLGVPHLDRIERIIARDPGLSAKLVQIANSAYFRRLREVHSLASAINFLGFDLVKAVVVNLAVVAQLRCREIDGRPIESVIDYSLDCAAMARQLAEAEGLPPSVCGDAFMAGLLHEIGLLVLADNFPAQMSEIAAAARAAREPATARERAAFGACHAQIGACILGTWGFLDTIVEAVMHHHDPIEAMPDRLDLTMVLRIAIRLVDAGAAGAADDPIVAEAMRRHPQMVAARPDDRRVAAAR
ncbi:MAG: HDOD domain-containing protein [Alphaproteobacteria bacterium]|nr:HDOD domain-containing protein [Alphaproteobacteria bacterium]